MKDKFMSFFSSLGRSLMMPIAALAASGIFLGITAALLKPQTLEVLPFLATGIPFYVISVLNKVSGVVFTLIPALFAISIAFGLATGAKEIAAFAGFIGYYTFLVSTALMVGETGFIDPTGMKMSVILGVETVDMGAVAGLVVGIMVASLHNRFHRIEFPAAIAFYGGKRFVAIVTILASATIGQLAPIVWMPVSAGINALGNAILGAGPFGVFAYGFLERFLGPTGLHHVLNGIVRTTPVGGVYEGVEGCLNIFVEFFDKLPATEIAQYTQFLGQGKMPFMIFGLPAAALAIYQTAPAEKKEKVKALMIAGAGATAISGITEPLEFSFLFIAPVLFMFHTIMGGLSFALMSILGVAVGQTGGGLIDMLIWGVFQEDSKWYLIVAVGLVYAVIYYTVFKWYFTKKNITVEVPDDDGEEAPVASKGKETKGEKAEKAQAVIDALGGKDNIIVVNNCISRLRVDLKDMSLVDDNGLKKTGCAGIVKPSETHIQVIYGLKVEGIADSVRDLL